jgi:ethanolamine ammonia-lyase small subunit
MANSEIDLAHSSALAKVRQRTPARLFVGRSGAAYRTATQLQLRAAHAAAADAVRNELDLERDLGAALIQQFELFAVQTAARDKAEYLRNPELGRHFDERAWALIRQRCTPGADLQVVIGDGLSVAAAAAQVPALLPLIRRDAAKRGWKIGQPFVVRYCRVGLMNDIGELLRPKAVVLLIGERPGLATAESLSAYLAFQPRPGHTDAHRNLISNVHARGVPVEVAAARIINFAAQVMEAGRSGADIKEQFTPALKGRAF